MKKNRILEYSLYLFSFVLLIITAYLLLSQDKNDSSDIYKKIIRENYKMQPFAFSLIRELNFKEIEVKNRKDARFMLDEISNNYNLLFILNGNSCWSCVENELENAGELSGGVALIGYNIQESYLFRDASFKDFENIFISEDLQNIDLLDRLQVPVIVKIDNSNIINMYISPKHNFEFPLFNESLK